MNGTCQDNLKWLETAVVSASTSDVDFPFEATLDGCHEFCRSLPDYSMQVSMMTHQTEVNSQMSDCTCIYRNDKLPSRDAMPSYSKPSSPKFTLTNSDGMALGLRPNIACDTDEDLMIETQVADANNPSQQFLITQDGQVASVRCPEKVLTNVLGSDGVSCTDGVGLQLKEYGYVPSTRSPTTSPTTSPTRSPTTTSPTASPTRKCFKFKSELREVIKYCFQNNSQLKSLCESKKALFGSSINNWCFDGITDMSGLFHYTDFNEPINGWDVSGVKYMDEMFSYATNFNQDLSGWNTEQVTNMESMFYRATAFNSNIGGWNVGRVTNMVAMFDKATAFNINIGSWNVSSVRDMGYMFRYAVSFNQDLSRWNTTSSMDFIEMFYGATAFNQNLCAWKERITYKRYEGYFNRWVDTVEDMFKNSGCTDKENPTQYYFRNFCSEVSCPTPTSPDYIEIGNWRIAHICETCEQSHLSISSDNNITSQVFREDGTVHPGPRNDYNGWGAVSSAGPTFSSQGITFGNMAVQISDWRIRQIDNKHMSISHKDGNVARIYKSDGTLHENDQQYSGWKSDIGAPSCAYLTERYLQIGDWRFGVGYITYEKYYSGSSRYPQLSVAHKGGKVPVVYKPDGSVWAVPPFIMDTFDPWIWYPHDANAYIIMGSNDGCPSPLTSSPTTSPTASPLTSSPTTSLTSKSLTSSPTTRPTSRPNGGFCSEDRQCQSGYCKRKGFSSKICAAKVRFDFDDIAYISGSVCQYNKIFSMMLSPYSSTMEKLVLRIGNA
eukprot:scaffold34361_cov94-Cyclotella_meneghiniana.AAC.1